MLMNGMNGPADFARAGTLLRKSCTLGSQSGCFNLGQMLTKGPEPIRDAGAAAAAVKEACRLGHKQACTLKTTPMQPGA
ncbi:MAG: hypothetical protein F9K41_12040 [Sphingopyxis terrae]|nr:MAG: hypothetical protein F9K41_12040 [Sphingopyxis terrae]